MNNEFDWIHSISPKKHFSEQVKVGIGDDAAIVAPTENFEQVLAVDTMVEGVHFTKDTMPIESIGYKALAVNLSDLAAMGAIPRYYLVSIAVPKKGWTEEERHRIYSGMNELATEWKVDLIGGDTVSIAENLVLSVTVIGEVPKNRRLLRKYAKPGDIVFVTGEVGHSAFGLEQLLRDGLKAGDRAEWQEAILAHQRPEPQLKIGQMLGELDARIALNDISDGVAHEAKEIAEASGCDLHLVWEKIPKPAYFSAHTQEDQENWTLYCGEEFQLIGTVSPEDWIKVKAAAKKEGFKITAAGSVEKGDGLVYIERNGIKEKVTKSGYHHF